LRATPNPLAAFLEDYILCAICETASAMGDTFAAGVRSRLAKRLQAIRFQQRSDGGRGFAEVGTQPVAYAADVMRAPEGATRPPAKRGRFERDEDIGQVRARAGRGKSIVFVSGNFNVLHPGHLRLLKFASEVGDFLVVGVNPNSTPGVTVPDDVRLEAVLGLAIVDHALLLREPAEQFIAVLRPEMVVKGKEFESRDNPEREVVAAYGGKLIFSSGEMRFASYEILDRDYSETIFSSIRKPLDFPKRHGFTGSDLKAILPKFADLKVLVIGDLIVDDYITCDPLGMSQEDPTIVVTPIETKTFVGGAGVVSAHARALGADVTFFTVVGRDDTADYARANLSELGVKVLAIEDATRPTPRKQRFRALGKTLLRVNHLRQHAVARDISQRLLNDLEKHLENTDLLMFSDFNYGCLPQALVDEISKRAAARGIMMTADSQASSQLADISRFKGMKAITPTEREARLAVRDPASGLAILASKLQISARAENVLVTLGSEGILIHGLEEGYYLTDRLPAFNLAPKDVAGAGDSLLTCFSLALCAGADIWQSSYLGALASACQVSRVGNSPLDIQDLLTEIDYPDGS
jgi:rfaE bifunctional protein kinase chain/domain